MKTAYNILVIDDIIDERYINDNNEYKIKVALEALLKNQATVNVFDFIGSTDYSSFLSDFVENEKNWDKFYAANKQAFEDIDVIIMDTKFPKAPNNPGIWGDKLTAKLIELDRRNKNKIIGVSNYETEGKHFLGQTYSDRLLVEKICKILGLTFNDIGEGTGNTQATVGEKNTGTAHAVPFKNSWYLSAKKGVSSSRPFVFEILTFLTSVLFVVVFGFVIWNTGERVINTFNNREEVHHNTPEFKAYDNQIKEVMDLLRVTYIETNDSLGATQLILNPKDSALRAIKEKKAKELYTTLYEMHRVHDSNPSTRTFELIENLFLLFIPLFVVLGFFVYFQKSLSKYLLGGNPDSDVDENAKKSIDVTKKLFLTSIFSFTIIKILDIFINDIGFLPYFTVPINIILKVSILTIVLVIIIWYNYSSRSAEHT